MFGNKKSKAKHYKEEAHWAHKPLPNNSLSGQFLLELYFFFIVFTTINSPLRLWWIEAKFKWIASMTPHYTPFQAIIFTDRVMTHTHTNTTKNRTSAVFSAHSYSKLLPSFFFFINTSKQYQTVRLNLDRRFWKIQWSWRPFLFGLCSYKHYVRFFQKFSFTRVRSSVFSSYSGGPPEPSVVIQTQTGVLNEL